MAEYTVFLFYCTGVDKKARLMAENDCYRGDWSNKASDSNCGYADFNFLYNYLTKEEKQHSQEFLLLFVI